MAGRVNPTRVSPGKREGGQFAKESGGKSNISKAVAKEQPVSPVLKLPAKPTKAMLAERLVFLNSFVETPIMKDLISRTANDIESTEERVKNNFIHFVTDLDEKSVSAEISRAKGKKPQSSKIQEASDATYRYDLIPNIPEDENIRKALKHLGYRHFMAQPYPVFVYGTLRAGEYFSYLFGKSRVEIVKGRAKGIALYGKNREERGIAFARPLSEGNAIGEVVWLGGEEEKETRRKLDNLEGFRATDTPQENNYERVLRPITILDAEDNETAVMAWIYIEGLRAKKYNKGYGRILNDDWAVSTESSESSENPSRESLLASLIEKTGPWEVKNSR
jgi:gamma-glutamylcyclotransferase (GGCT)/AIG2-like uncharacterized protein YtfP